MGIKKDTEHERIIKFSDIKCMEITSVRGRN